MAAVGAGPSQDSLTRTPSFGLRPPSTIARLGLGVVALAALVGLLLAFWPVKPPPLPSGPSAVADYASAVKELERERGRSEGVPEDRDVTWLLHGHPTDRVYVLMHGLCNCPKQYRLLARLLYESGANVLIPRTPLHGLSDRMNSAFAELTAGEMLASARNAVDLAHALGKSVTVVGLSINGTTAAWLAQNRADIDRVVLLSPFLSPAMIPEWSSAPVGRLALRLPNLFIWWNDKEKENLRGPSHAYPRFPTRVIGEVMGLGECVRVSADKRRFASGPVIVVTSASDNAASSRATEALVASWKKFRPLDVTTYEFPAGEKVPHDFIDPDQPDQKTGTVYPRLMEILEP